MSFGNIPFKEEEREKLCLQLSCYLDSDCVASRSNGGGVKVHYIEGWKAINLANDIWGFDGWSSSVGSINVDYIDEVNGRISAGVSAVVRVTIKNGTYHEDVGFGIAECMKSKGMALEKAKKEAVTDGLKRALRGFGNVLGNCLYDKNYLRAVSRMPSAKPKDIKPENIYQFQFHGGQRISAPRPKSHATRQASHPYATTATTNNNRNNSNNNNSNNNSNNTGSQYRTNKSSHISVNQLTSTPVAAVTSPSRRRLATARRSSKRIAIRESSLEATRILVQNNPIAAPLKPSVGRSNSLNMPSTSNAAVFGVPSQSIGSDDMFPDDDDDFYNIITTHLESNRAVMIESPPRYDPDMIDITDLDETFFAGAEPVHHTASMNESIRPST